MPTLEDLENAKKAHDHAWNEAMRYAKEAEEAARVHEQISARDTSDMWVEKIKRAHQAHLNWMGSVQLARKVIDEYYRARLG